MKINEKKYMKGPTTNFKLLTFCLFAPSLEIEKKKWLLLGSLSSLENPTQGAWKEKILRSEKQSSQPSSTVLTDRW